MNVMTQVHPFLDGKPKRLLIGGQWAAAASGQTFTSIDPSTGHPLTEVALADAEDVDRAANAARVCLTRSLSLSSGMFLASG